MRCDRVEDSHSTFDFCALLCVRGAVQKKNEQDMLSSLNLFVFLVLINRVSPFPSTCMDNHNIPVALRVVSYNVLSDKLCSPSHYTHSQPSHLENNYRFKLVTKFLKKEVKSSAIICLQEVSEAWKNKFKNFFGESDYAFAEAQYGAHYTGYMGVFMAWPKHKYITIKKTSLRISESAYVNNGIGGDNDRSHMINHEAATTPTGHHHDNDGVWWSVVSGVKSLFSNLLLNRSATSPEVSTTVSPEVSTSKKKAAANSEVTANPADSLQPKPSAPSDRLFGWDTWNEVLSSA
jgi:hypothetical protein